MRRACLAALALLPLAACTAIPVSTLARLGRFDERDFAALDPARIRLRVSLPEGYGLDAAASSLHVELVASGTPYRGDFAVERESVARRVVAEGWLAAPQATTAWVLRLTPASLARFRALQHTLGGVETRDLKLDVHASLASAPPGAASVQVWIDVLLSLDEGYITLIDGGTIALGRKATYKPPGF
ncbi:MAG: hypothetical protein ACXWG3_08200 [Usitatibacter sp.]